MKILCAECFNTINKVVKNKAVCSECGKEYDLTLQASLFKVRLEGGYIKDGLTKEELVKFIKDGKILPDEYVASAEGPWIALYDSAFIDNLPEKDKTARSAAVIYEKKRSIRILIVTLTSLLVLSLCANAILVTLLYIMNTRINSLIEKIIGG